MGRKLLLIIYSIIVACFYVSACSAQTLPTDSTSNKIKGALLNYYKRYPREKIFIHASQNVYTSGQTIWYALYATAYGKPSALSKIGYVQLVNQAGRMIVQNKLPLKNGSGNGNIDLPDSIKTGWYQLRGFTSWMMNFGWEDYFHQNIYIQNTGDVIQKEETQPPVAAKYHVDFYPEGGDLIDGQVCNVAFKAADDSGAPVNIDGQVIDNNNQVVAPIVTTHDGLGIFRLDIRSGTYTAVINFPDKTVQKIVLPPVKKEGVAILVKLNSPTDIRLRIAYTGSPEKYKNVLLAAFQNNGNVVTYPLGLGQGINQFEMKKSLFSTGILRLTLFDSNNVPLAERLVFIDNHDNLKPQLKADIIMSSSHAKQEFNLSLDSNSSKYAGGNFSVSVTDADAFEKDSVDNICSSLLLSSELRGVIHNPGWYFRSDNNMQLLDLVMLTNGWRHFKWKEILNNQPVKLQYPVERSQFIAGKIENYQRPPAGKPQDLIKLIIISQDSSKYIGYVTPDSTGSFILKDYNHSGISQLYLETTDEKNHVKKLQIKLFNTLNDSLKDAAATSLAINGTASMPFTGELPPVTGYLLSKSKMERQYQLQSSGILLNTVHIKSQKVNPTDRVIADHVDPLYHSITEYTLDLIDAPAPDISLIDYIKGRFPGLQIYTDEDTAKFIYRSTSTITGNPQPYIYLNERLTTFYNVKDINLHNVALIRFMPPPVGFAPYNGGSVGAIMIYTKKGPDEVATMESREKFDKYTFNGYTITREFSSPDYSLTKNKATADYRTTLYWNPHLNIDSSGKVNFHFFNSDTASHFRIIIQGMDADGHTAYLDQVF